MALKIVIEPSRRFCQQTSRRRKSFPFMPQLAHLDTYLFHKTKQNKYCKLYCLLYGLQL